MDVVIGLWAFLSLLRLLWLLSLVEFYGVCTHGILNITFWRAFATLDAISHQTVEFAGSYNSVTQTVCVPLLLGLVKNQHLK